LISLLEEEIVMYTADQIVRAILDAAGEDDVFASRLERASRNDDLLLRFIGEFTVECGQEVAGHVLNYAVTQLAEALSG